MQTINLTSHFLIAMPAMSDPNFSRTLTFVCEHNERGALGIVVNRPIDVNLAALFRQVEIPLGTSPIGEQPVFFGGPVQFDHGFVLHRPVGAWKSTLPVGDIGLTTSRDILEAMATGSGPRQQLVALGYAGWGEGQLDEELTRHGWFNVQGDMELLYDTEAETRWELGFAEAGIDPRLLASSTGTA